MDMFEYEVIVIGVSAGGMEALRKIIPELPGDYPCPIAIVQHLHPQSDDFLVTDFLHYLQIKKILLIKSFLFYRHAI